IEIAKRIQETRSPTVAAARGLGGFGEPDRFTRCKPVAQPLVERKPAIRPGQPVLGKCRVRRSVATTTLRDGSVKMIRNRIETGHRGGEKVRGGVALARRAGSEDHRIGPSLPHE